MPRPAPARCLVCRRPLADPGPPGAPAAAPSRPAHAPFCSERCKMVDLGRWLEGEYRIPGEDLASLDPSELARLEGAARAEETGEDVDPDR